MDISVTFNGLTAVEAAQLIAGVGGLTAHAVPAAAAQAPAPAAPATMPPAAAAPPAPPAPPAAAQNPMVGQVTAAMQTYSKAHGAQGVALAKRVLAQCGLGRASDGTPEQLAWLLQAFSNTAYVPPG